jgi:hypothetical protein
MGSKAVRELLFAISRFEQFKGAKTQVSSVIDQKHTRQPLKTGKID